MDDRLTPLFATGPVRLADHRALEHQLDYAVKQGEVMAPFKGIYLTPDATFDHRVAALRMADPTAITTGATAAYLHGWREAPDAISAASTLRPRPGYDLVRRRIPRELIATKGGRRTSRALTVLDLARIEGASAIDEGLRRRVKLADLERALDLTPQVAGNKELRVLLDESRTEPWSPAERGAHKALHAGRVRGWVTNHQVSIDEHTTYAIDIAFKAIKLGFEIDGREFHDDPVAFIRDRLRDLSLARRTWQVIRIPAQWALENPVLFAEAVREIVELRTALFR